MPVLKGSLNQKIIGRTAYLTKEIVQNRIHSKIMIYICIIRKANRIVLRLENSTFKKLNETCLVFNGGLRLRVSFMDGRLQKEPTTQILFIGVFSTNDNAVFSM